MPHSSPLPSRASLIAAFATIYIVWGSTYLGMRVAVETMPPFAMASARFLLAGAILYTVNTARRLPSATLHQWRDNIVVGTLLLLGGNGLVSWAEQYIPSGIAALVIGVTPVAMVLIEWAWPGGQRPRPLTFLGLALGTAGVAWLAAPWENTSHGGLHPGGVLALIAACTFWAFGSIVSRHVKTPAPLFVASAIQMLGGGTALAFVALARGEFQSLTLASISAHSWYAFFHLVAIGSLVGFSTYVWLIKHSTPSRVATYAYVNPVVAVFLGWLLLHEPITPRTLAAAAVIVVAVIIITLPKTARSAP